MKYEKGLVSVIIPCFNHGKYLYEVVDSVLRQTYDNIEIIVVNDGSTEKETIQLLKVFEKPRTKLIHTKNQGLAMARNNGIKVSRGEYFLPLDADDRLDPWHLEKTVGLMQKNKKTGVVYTDLLVFGDYSQVYKLRPFEIVDELAGNYVSVCSLVKRVAYDQVKKENKYGYNPNMKYGYEDWDFWLSIYELGWKFAYIDESLFHYRRAGESMIDRAQKKHDVLIKQLMKNHPELFKKYYIEVIQLLQSKVKTLELEMIMRNKLIYDLENPPVRKRKYRFKRRVGR